jgi:hypothetical protein
MSVQVVEISRPRIFRHHSPHFGGARIVPRRKRLRFVHCEGVGPRPLDLAEVGDLLSHRMLEHTKMLSDDCVVQLDLIGAAAKGDRPAIDDHDVVG